MLNKVSLIGNLGGDPVVRQVGEDRKVANLSLATRRRWKDREGNLHEDTQWHQLVLWDRQAELAERLLTKGQLVYVEGRLNTVQWTDPKNEEKTYHRTEVVGQNFLILSPKGSTAGEGQESA